MKSLQEYREIYREIASKLNLQGDSVELLVQLLSQATYIDEVENIAYMREASIEKATLLNSKIQHCMDNMYSVFRGNCPRVIMKFKANKYLTFKMFDEIVSSNNFKVYYLGYYDTSTTTEKTVLTGAGASVVATEEGFNYGPISIIPDEETDVVIIGLLAKETSSSKWSLTDGNFYVETYDENLSNDISVKVDNDYAEVTRVFDDHILNNKIYDLTTTSFGSRLYLPNPEGASVIEATYYKQSRLADYNQYELQKMEIRGTDLTKFEDDGKWSKWLQARNYDSEISEIAPGIIVLDGTAPDTIGNLHYRASKERYVASIIRSNSDIGIVLEETYPDKVRTEGTTYQFTENYLTIYYVPIDVNNLLDSDEIEDFRKNRTAYYITDGINIKPGIRKEIIFSIDIDLYQNYSVDDEISNILKTYGNRFGVDLSESSSNFDEIKTLIGKISNVSKVNSISIKGLPTTNLEKTYYDISATITARVSNNNL